MLLIRVLAMKYQPPNLHTKINAQWSNLTMLNYYGKINGASSNNKGMQYLTQQHNAII